MPALRRSAPRLGRQLEGLAAPWEGLEFLTDAQAIQLDADEIQGALAFGEVPGVDALRKGEQPAGSLGRVGKAADVADGGEDRGDSEQADAGNCIIIIGEGDHA